MSAVCHQHECSRTGQWSTEDPTLTWFPGGGADGRAAGTRAGAVLGPDADQVAGAGLQAGQPSREAEDPQRLGVAPPRTAGPVENLEPAHSSSESVVTASGAPTVTQLHPVAHRSDLNLTVAVSN